MPKDHSASPLSCGLLKAGKVFVSSFVQTSKGSWRDMVQLPSSPKIVHRQDGGTAPCCQVLFYQALTMIAAKNPIPERGCRRVSPGRLAVRGRLLWVSPLGAAWHRKGSRT